MKLYQAGFYASNFDLEGNVFKKLDATEKQARLAIRHNLESYHYVYRQSAVDKLRRDGVKVFLDSGAYSAFTQGIEVNIPKYCEYVQKNADIIETVDGVLMASVLDGIGDPLKTWQNQLHMEHLGVKPICCFHYGEDEKYLEHYMANYEYIALGGLVPISVEQKTFWLDRIFDKYLCDGAGRLKIKVHGFGLTSLPLMKRYPWYSVDSSTWVQWASNGMILVPEVGQINVSSKSSSRKIEGQHLNTITPPQRQAILSKIRKMGFDPTRLADEYVSRWAFNALTFQMEGELSTLEQFVKPQEELF